MTYIRHTVGRRNEQAGTEPRTTLPCGLYPPRFAAPVRPGDRTATDLMQPGWPRPHPPTPSTVEPRRSPALVRAEDTPAAHVPEPRIDRSTRDGIGVALQPL